MSEDKSGHDEHEDIKKFLVENRKLLNENNKILKKIHRNAMWALWVRIGWYAVLIGLPFALYFYVLEPYFAALGSDYETFKAGINEIPGLKNFNNVVGGGG